MKKAFTLLALTTAFAGTAIAQNTFLDSTFSNDGLIYDLSTVDSRITDIAVQSDGKIVGCIGRNNRFEMFRLNADGTLDNTFGAAGKIDYQLTSGQNEARDIEVQPDGKILVMGSAYASGADVGLIRMNADGTLDNTFGTGGIVITNSNGASQDAGRTLMLRPNGKILVAGFKNTLNNDNVVMLIQYNADGTLDNTFASNGIMLENYMGQSTDVFGAYLQTDGKVVVTGSTANNNLPDVWVARFEDDGGIDNGFGTNGWVKKDMGTSSFEGGRKVVVQSTGKVVVMYHYDVFVQNFKSFRLNADGTDDLTYGTAGTANPIFSTSSSDAQVVLLLPNDEILMGGYVNMTGSDFEYGIAKLDANGNLVPGFANGGKISTDFLGAYDMLYAMAVQADGKIVAAGSTRTSTTTSDAYPSLARYKANPVSVKELTVNNSFAVYPNPNSGTVYIKGTRSAQLQVVDVTGRLQQSAALTSANSYSVTLSNLPAGIHFIKSSDGGCVRVLTIK